jgi:hypothetical protein
VSGGFANPRGFGPYARIINKNNFICVSIVKRDKRTRDAGRSAGQPMSERAFNFSVHFRVGRGARTVLYKRLSIPSRNPQKTKTETAYDP